VTAESAKYNMNAGPTYFDHENYHTNIMKTHFISDGVAFRNRKMHNVALSKADKRYLREITNYVDKVWMYFSEIEEDFRLLHMPLI